MRRVVVRDGADEKKVASSVERLLSRQGKDGGWSQLPDMPSDAYATGQVLYGLSLAGVKPDHEAVKGGVTFLLTSQKDGSWPMKPRSHPGATPAKNKVPITYFGSAWAMLGLMRSLPK